MLKRHPLTISVLVTLLVALGAGVVFAGPPAQPLAASAAPTVVSYQGQVTVGGVPHNGSGYFKFAVVDAAGTTSYWSNDGTASGEPVNAVELTVSNGLFTVLLGDSGMNALTADVFDGSERYLRVWFCQSATGSFVQLAPDRRIAAVPYALQATNADALDGQHAAAFWQLGGNAGTTGSHFLGTSDGQPLELRVNGARALRLEPNATSPNVIGGHWANNATAGVLGATIGGGGSDSHANLITDDYGTVGGGLWNQAGDGAGSTGDHPYATVGGGVSNTASGSHATIAGGGGNTASGKYATVAGGAGNEASGQDAAVGGGWANYATGASATVPGGVANIAAGTCGFAAGMNAHANHDGAFVWGDYDVLNSVSSTDANQFIVRASGGIWLGTTSSPSIPSGYFLNTSTGAYLTSGGTWTNSSDRNAKENLAPVDVHAVLARLAAMPISTWSYKAEDASVRHMGPMAQDFYAAFGLGDSDTSIGTIDADGVALAAIQGLYAQNQALQAENAALRAQMAGIEARLAALEQGR